LIATERSHSRTDSFRSALNPAIRVFILEASASNGGTIAARSTGIPFGVAVATALNRFSAERRRARVARPRSIRPLDFPHRLDDEARLLAARAVAC